MLLSICCDKRRVTFTWMSRWWHRWIFYHVSHSHIQIYIYMTINCILKEHWHNMSRFGAVCNALKKLRLVNHILGGLQIVKNVESIRGTTLIYQQNGCYTQYKHKQLIAGDRRKHIHTLQYFRNITLLCFSCKSSYPPTIQNGNSRGIL